MSLQVRNILALILLILAFVRPIAYLTENYTLDTLGMSLGISPLPMPFTQRGEYENYSTDHDVYIEYVNGRTERLSRTTDSSPVLHGPHRYKIVLFVSFTWQPILPDILTEPVYKHIFCSGTYLQEAVKKIRIEHTAKRDNTHISTKEYACT